MRRWLLTIAATAAMLGTSPASARMTITYDLGGPIHEYERRFAMLLASGEPVVIDGPCLSACTLVLQLPPGQACVTKRARLGFHAAWFPSSGGQRVVSVEHTHRLHQLYPNHVQHWLLRNGGLQPRMIYMQGAELEAYIQPCRWSTGSRLPRGQKPRLAATR